MVHDGLWDPYKNAPHGQLRDLAARRRSITRQEQDEMAILSYNRALQATKEGKFKAESCRRGPGSGRARPSSSTRTRTQARRQQQGPGLKPAFNQDGT